MGRDNFVNEQSGSLDQGLGVYKSSLTISFVLNILSWPKRGFPGQFMAH